MKRKISYFFIFTGLLLLLINFSTPKWDYFDAKPSFRSPLLEILGLVGGLLLALGIFEIILTTIINSLNKKKNLSKEKISE